MTLGRAVVVIPPDGSPQTVGGSARFVHGGERYRRIAESVLAPHVEIRHAGWAPDAGLEERAEVLAGALPDAAALVMAPWLSLSGMPTLGGDRLELGRALKVIAGTFDYRLDWVDLDEMARRGVTVVDTSRTMTPTVAEFGVAITLALLRDIPQAIDVVREGGWLPSPMAQEAIVVRDLAECRVGLAGYGSINRHYRRFVRPYGCEVRIYDPFVSDEAVSTDHVVRTTSLVELADASDILVVAIPPTPSTLGVVDAAVIEALPRGSLFVLLSRMAVVEQEPLWRRLEAGELKAAIDVFDPEPPPTDAWFRRARNVLPTPHIAGNVAFAHERCFREACTDALRVLSGELPLHAATMRDKGIYDGSLVNATTERDPG